MARKDEIIEKVRGIAAPLAEAEGLELVDVELAGPGGHPTVRLYIDREGGVSLDDCTSVSRSVSAALDVEDPIEGAYDLEVSSPGLEHPLRTPEHFQRFAGQRVRIKAFAPLEEAGNRKTFVGTLEGYEDGRVLVEVDGAKFRIPLEQIAKARVEPTFDDLAAADDDLPDARLQVNGRYQLVRSREDVRGALKEARKAARSEVIVHREGEGLFGLFSEGLAVLLLIPYEQHGFSSRNPRYAGGRDVRLRFTRSNGQEDEFPASWAVRGEDAARALEHYFFTGQRPSFIEWHDDDSGADATV